MSTAAATFSVRAAYPFESVPLSIEPFGSISGVALRWLSHGTSSGYFPVRRVLSAITGGVGRGATDERFRDVGRAVVPDSG